MLTPPIAFLAGLMVVRVTLLFAKQNPRRHDVKGSHFKILKPEERLPHGRPQEREEDIGQFQSRCEEYSPNLVSYCLSRLADDR